MSYFRILGFEKEPFSSSSLVLVNEAFRLRVLGFDNESSPPCLVLEHMPNKEIL